MLTVSTHRLAAIRTSVSSEVPLVLHGTHPVSDELFKEAVKRGTAKVNLNRAVRDPYSKFVAEQAGRLELTRLKEEGVEIYAKGVERMMDILGSTGKAL